MSEFLCYGIKRPWYLLYHSLLAYTILSVEFACKVIFVIFSGGDVVTDGGSVNSSLGWRYGELMHDAYSPGNLAATLANQNALTTGGSLLPTLR